MVTGNVVRTISKKMLLAFGAGAVSAGVMYAKASVAMPVHAQAFYAQALNIDIDDTGANEVDSGLVDELPGISDGDDSRPLAQDGSILSMIGAQRLMEEAAEAVSDEDYELAVEKYKDARQVYNQLSNFYQDLASSFSGVDTFISSAHRARALETAQQRDRATYRLALVHRAQSAPDLAVPLLIQIIRSQQPTRELGENAYRQLFELGFVDSPYPYNQEVGSSVSDSADNLSN
ncbi:MAG: hypothetical protein AAGD25_40150 [Cyanobacteria bacterium P01_F01_bin.150]